MTRYQQIEIVNQWTDEAYAKYMYLFLWLSSQKKDACWRTLEQNFLENFGRRPVDDDPARESGKMIATQNPLVYYVHTRKHPNASNPKVTKRDRICHIIDGLPPHYKAQFVEDETSTVAEFRTQLQNTQRMWYYYQQAA